MLDLTADWTVSSNSVCVTNPAVWSFTAAPKPSVVTKLSWAFDIVPRATSASLSPISNFACENRKLDIFCFAAANCLPRPAVVYSTLYPWKLILPVACCWSALALTDCTLLPKPNCAVVPPWAPNPAFPR